MAKLLAKAEKKIGADLFLLHDGQIFSIPAQRIWLPPGRIGAIEISTGNTGKGVRRLRQIVPLYNQSIQENFGTQLASGPFLKPHR